VGIVIGTEIDARVDTFVRRLEDLDAGERAVLRRNAGRTLAEAHSALGLFYRLLPPNVPRSAEESYFLVASLFPLAESGSSHDFGRTMRVARSLTNTAGLDRRMEALLDSDREQLRFRLRRAVHVAHSCRVSVQWSQLLRDVLHWQDAGRHVQRRWASSYFAELD
jgi:CRISPR system Cascade subunit CasB